jgi:ubiquinone/menaquinone biosynthesis C-methylase UbiE
MGEKTRFNPLIARLYDYINLYFERRQAPQHRQYLAADISGTVLEIGPGTGTMLPYFESQRGVTAYYGIEPDPGMRRQVIQRVDNTTLDGDVIAGRAEQLPFSDGDFDVVVASCVFCSVPDIDPALSEIARVLDTDGEFRFFEHVRSTGLIGRSQDMLTPLWRRFGGNCRLNREFVLEIREEASLSLTEVQSYSSGHYPIRRFVRGRANPQDR